MFKKVIAVVAVLALALAPVAFATDETELTPNGVSQGTLIRYLKNLQTTVNELAADHDADNAAVAELIADHDADNNVLNGYETLLEELAADHDADNNEFALAVTELTELKADHDADNDVITDIKTLANGLRTYLNDGMLAHGTLAISAVPEKYKTTTTTIYTISGVAYAYVATDNLTFSAAYTINTAVGAGDFWGVFLIQIDGTGTVSTKAPAADQVYISEAAAIAALPAADAANVAIGYITVEANNGAAWVANTDDMTPASDCQAANFYNIAIKTIPAAVASSPAADLTAANPTGFAADLAAGTTVNTVAADLTANTQAADLSSDSVIGSGTVDDPSVSLTD